MFLLHFVMQETGSKIHVLLADLKACSKTRNLERGKQVHAEAMKCTLVYNIYISNALINMYAKCGSMADARHVFDSMMAVTVVSWTALILGYAENGEGNIALYLFSIMRNQQPDSVTLMSALKACISLVKGTECLERGRAIHNIAEENGCILNVYLENSLLDMYAKCRSMIDAHKVFDGMKNQDVVSWTALILGYTENDECSTALNLFVMMRTEGPSPNSVTFVAALKACSSFAVKEGATGRTECCDRGKMIRNLAMENGCNSDVYVENSSIDMYTKCGNMMDAREVFDSMKRPNVVSCNALISGYVENGQSDVALDLLTSMRTKGPAPNHLTLVVGFKACSSLAMKGGSQLMRGKELHKLAVDYGFDSEVYVKNALIDMYANCGCMMEARKAFDGMEQPDVVSWNTLISGYAENGQGHNALLMFTRMRTEGPVHNSLTLVAALKGCISFTMKEEEHTQRGKVLHSLVVENGLNSDVFVQNCLISMYMKCGSMMNARVVFEGTRCLDVVSWNALILGYADNCQGHTALSIFTRMRTEGPPPNSVTFGFALKSCGLVGALEYGKTIHSEIYLENDINTVLVNHLVDFYAKCGSLIEAQRVFDLHLELRNVITWTALLAGFSSCGHSEAVFGLFEGMQDAGFRPDGITFLCILTCCSHTSLVVEGKDCFDAMETKYGVTPAIQHYNCLIDLLGRANMLDDALVLLKRIPFGPDEVTWMTILGACRKWKNLEIGRIAFQSLIDCNSQDGSAYVLMGQIYGSRGMLQEQRMVIGLREKLNSEKRPEKSCWTTEAGAVHMFMVEENRHPQIHEIREKWETMGVLMRQHSLLSGDVIDSENEESLCGHSERLALSCALLNTDHGRTVRIVKNLSMCENCHTATAIISELECRTIIFRDASSIHVFKNGRCSCDDKYRNSYYWGGCE